MKLALTIAILALALPQPEWLPVSEPTPFYVFDGSAYTALFMLPETYFLAVEERGEEFDRVSFLDLTGYVRGGMPAAGYEPANKYPTSGGATLKKSVSSAWLYSDAGLTNVVGEVTAADEIFLYGDAVGADAYYVRVGSGPYRRGYLSAESADAVYPPENDVSAVAPSDPSPAPDDETQTPESGASSPGAVVQAVLITALAVPAFLLVFLLSSKKTGGGR